MRVIQGEVAQSHTAFESPDLKSNDEAGYIDPSKAEEEQICTDDGIYSYAYADPTRMDKHHIHTEPDDHIYEELDDHMNQVELHIYDEPSSLLAPSPPAPSPPAPSPPPCFLIPDLRTGIKVWFGAITMALIIIGVGCLLILYYPGKTIFKCVFYFMITLKSM